MKKNKTQNEFSFRAYARKQFRHNKPAYISLYILLFLAIIAILAPILANQKPLFVKYEGNNYFPAFSGKIIISSQKVMGVLKIFSWILPTGNKWIWKR